MTLDALAAGSPLTDQQAFADWNTVREHYAAQSGVDPTPGREFWEHLKASPGLEAN